MSLLKRENGIGITKGSIWGTSVEPGTGDGFYVKSHTPATNMREVFKNDTEFDHPVPTIQTLGNYPAPEGTLVFPFYYEGLEKIFATMFGIYNGVDNLGIITHNFKLNPVLSGLFHTIAYDEGDEVKSIRSAVMNTCKIAVDETLTLEVGYIGDKVQQEAGFTTPLALTYVSTGVNLFQLLHTDVYINDQTGADFVDGDKVCVNNIEININRGFVPQPHCAGNPYIEEPNDINPPMFDVILNFPKKDDRNKAFFANFETNTEKKMKIEMTGALIGGTDYYKFTLNFPRVVLRTAPVYDQESPIPTTIEFDYLEAATAPTGMTEIYPYASLINEVPVLTGYPAS